MSSRFGWSGRIGLDFGRKTNLESFCHLKCCGFLLELLSNAWIVEYKLLALCGEGLDVAKAIKINIPDPKSQLLRAQCDCFLKLVVPWNGASRVEGCIQGIART